MVTELKFFIQLLDFCVLNDDHSHHENPFVDQDINHHDLTKKKKKRVQDRLSSKILIEIELMLKKKKEEKL